MITTETEFLQCISGFDLPEMRVADFNLQNLRWLQRNMGIRNSDHPRYHSAVALLNLLLKQATSSKET